MLGIQQGSRNIHAQPDSDKESSNEEELLNLRADIVDESGCIPDLSPDTSGQQHSVCVPSDDVKSVLLGSHKCVLEDILLALLRK